MLYFYLLFFLLVCFTYYFMDFEHIFKKILFERNNLAYNFEKMPFKLRLLQVLTLSTIFIKE